MLGPISIKDTIPQVGDLLYIKHITSMHGPQKIRNSFGIVLRIDNEESYYGGPSYIWFSQQDLQEYYLYKSEVDGEIFR